jgi:hypothetical protein
MEKVTVLRTELVPITTVIRHPDNARKGDTARIEASIRAHGQYAPLVVHEPTGYIVKGNNTHRVLAEVLGRSEVLVTYISCSEVQARAILVADNRSSDDATYDETSLLALLEQVERDGTLALTGWNQGDLVELTTALEALAPDLDEPDPFDDPAPSTLDRSDDAQPSSSLQEHAKDYDAHPTRVMNLVFSLPQYRWLTGHLRRLSEEFEGGYAEAILHLVGDAVDETPPRDDAGA